MFYYLNGKLALAEPNTAVLDCGGVGYRLTVSGSTLGHLAGKLNAEVRLYTYLAVREDGIELFGFFELAERHAFEMLLGVSGVGPKAAISVLTLLSPAALSVAVATEDKKAISKASGIGPKTAARIILELKDKIAKELSADMSDTDDTGTGALPAESGIFSDALNTLLVLGYSRPEGISALHGLDTEQLGLEETVRAALRRLSQV